MARAAKTTKTRAKPLTVAPVPAPTKKAKTAKPPAASERPSPRSKPSIAPKPTPLAVAALKTKDAVKSQKAAVVPRQTTPTPAPKLTIGELRAQVEKLELTVATLRTKSREANRAAKHATARIAELEAEVAQLQKAAGVAEVTSVTAKPASIKPKTRPKPSIDPGDAVPAGVAVQEPAPLDLQAEIAKENLESHLGQVSQQA